MRRILLTLALLLLTSCVAPDGSTVTLATIDDAGAVQVQIVDVTGEQEFYRGAFAVCLMATYGEEGAPDVPGCYGFVAELYAHEAYQDEIVMSVWDWEVIRFEETDK